MDESCGSIKLVFALACALSAAGGCTSTPPENGELVVQELIGPAGGVIEGRGIRLEIPAGAILRDTQIEIRAPDRDLSVRDYRQLGGAIGFEPAGLELQLPAKLSSIDRAEALVFLQGGLPVAAQGDTAWIDELSVAAIASAGIPAVRLAEPVVGASPNAPGETIRDVVHMTMDTVDIKELRVSLVLYDVQQVYTKELNRRPTHSGSGTTASGEMADSEGDCGMELSKLSGGSLASGCSVGPFTATIVLSGSQISFDASSFQAGSLATPVVVGIVAGSDELAYQLGFFAFDTDPCLREDCSDAGTCMVDSSGAYCACNDGYVPGDGLTCECVPRCEGLECGDNGCGGVCGGCDTGSMCMDGTCVLSSTGTAGTSGTGGTGGTSTDAGGSSGAATGTTGGSTSVGATTGASSGATTGGSALTI